MGEDIAEFVERHEEYRQFPYRCSANKLTTIIGTRLAVPNQVVMEKDKLISLYEKLKIPIHLVDQDYKLNQKLLNQCFELGEKTATSLEPDNAFLP